MIFTNTTNLEQDTKIASVRKWWCWKTIHNQTSYKFFNV